MSKQPVQLLVTVFALILAACSEPQSDAVPEVQSTELMESEAEPMPASEVADASPVEMTTGADPTVVDPDHYAVEFENDVVRVLRITYGPGEESTMHFHPDSVAVYLDDIEAQFTLPDGSIVDGSGRAGETMFGPAGEHLPKNTGDTAFEVIEVELKSRDGAPSAAEGPDPTVVDPDHYAVEFENDAVRVLRITYGPGEESTMHYHPDSVAVFLTDHLVEMNLPDGSSESIEAAEGDVLFVPAGQHLPRNISEAGVEILLVELKY